ncbi:uncharacterized protein F5147DRAFT_764637 [Suillus discolor]|uniref:Uncharacterized protein n=1 Tax=Suillus discolor TaxID=1912936 RepID=A0A9P7EUE5_9AGAM|nr:uncharacterized protein F5147DRAFT_764637 [Suillus discolor]KAG2088921.1 hypothetical protein F5147DRAFT_764637 [Suillus discolor]
MFSYILTVPAEWRFYRSESSFFHLSYVSIVTIVVSNYGFFSTTFTQQTCQKYYLVAPIFKGVRCVPSNCSTFNIARRDRRIGIALLLLYILSISAEWFVDLFHGTQPKAAVLDLGKVLSTWFYYFPVMLYDIVMVTVSTMHLLRYNPLSSRVERLIRVVERIEPHILSYDQYRDPEMTQPNAQHIEKVIVARPSTLNMQKTVMSGLRSQFESKSYSRGSRSFRSPINTEFRPTSPRNPNDIELNIRIPVERPVAVDESRNSGSWGPPVGEPRQIHSLTESANKYELWSADVYIKLYEIDMLPRSGPEPWFEPDFWSGSPRFGPWFLRQPEPDRKTVLGSRSSQTVQFWFGLPEPFRTLIDFDFDNTCLDVRLSSSGFTLLINQATFSLFEGIPEVLFIEDWLQHCARLPFTGGGYVRRGQGGFWRDCVLRYAAEGQHPSLPAHNPSHATPPAPMAIANDPEVFPEPHRFNPQRWIDDAVSFISRPFLAPYLKMSECVLANRSVFINTALIMWAFHFLENPVAASITIFSEAPATSASSAATEAEGYGVVIRYFNVLFFALATENFRVQSEFGPEKNRTGPQRTVLCGLVRGSKILQNRTMVRFLVLIQDPLNWTEPDHGSTNNHHMDVYSVYTMQHTDLRVLRLFMQHIYENRSTGYIKSFMCI